MCVHISWQVKNNWREAQIEHGEPKEPYTCTSRGAPAYFVSYLYNYFKVSTDFGFPFREKTIKPCSPGLSGGSVRIISLQTVQMLRKKPTCNASKLGNISISFVNFQSSGHLSVPYLIVPEVIEKVSGRTAGCTDLNINSPVGLSLRGTLFELFGRLTFTFPTFFHTQESVYGSDMNLLPTLISLHLF